MSNRMVAVWLVDAGFPGLRDPERGKSELRRAVCRITSGRVVSGVPDSRFAWWGALKATLRKVPQKIYRRRPGERTVRAVLLEPDARVKQAQAVAEPLD
jgi:hypothetical protein